MLASGLALGFLKCAKFEGVNGRAGTAVSKRPPVEI